MARDLPIPPGLAGLEAAVEGHAGLPPVERWNPPYCGDSGMRIAGDGTWFHQGAVITRPALVRLFSTILRKDDDGFMLVTPVEKLSIAVEDAPFVAVLMEANGKAADMHLTFTTNVGDKITAGPDHALRFIPDAKTGAPIPYLHVRQGLEAKLARPVYYAMVELAVARGGDFGVWSDGIYFVMGAIP
ncbi:MAG TPA: DUF1285 domain-containing protein [Rhizomicrobium sp.]|jgi:uncharacterized protein|nr:DUF1285 domain-containing protein [Rhizomicrobium sp.]